MTFAIIRERILIDAGPSEAGWSTLSSFSHCERLYYLAHKAPDAERHWQKEPLVRGSIGHVGLAHEYARRYAVKHGTDPDAYYTRHDAMELSAVQHGDMGKKMLPVAAETVDAYFDHYDALGEDLDVIAVEAPVALVTGDGRKITQRLDLVLRDMNGRVWINDHKLVSDVSQKTVDRYTLSGGFLLAQHIGRAFWGPDFGGVIVNLLRARPEAGEEQGLRFKRRAPEPAPAALAAFPAMVVELRRRIDEREATGLGVHAYMPSFNETTCVTAYGKCLGYEACQWSIGLST